MIHPDTHLPITQWHSNLRTDRAPPLTLSQAPGDSAIIVWPQFDPHREGQLFLLLFSLLARMKAGFHRETQQVMSPLWKSRNQTEEEFRVPNFSQQCTENKKNESFSVKRCHKITHNVHRNRHAVRPSTLSHLKASSYWLVLHSKLKYISHSRDSKDNHLVSCVLWSVYFAPVWSSLQIVTGATLFSGNHR